MNILKIFLAILFVLLSIGFSKACQCERLYFCEYLKGPDKKIVIKARVANYKEYSPNNTAAYLEVLKVFRDDVGITNIIKLYGKATCCECLLDFTRQFIVGSTIYLAMGLEYNNQDAGYEIINPEDIYENFWEFYPSSCLSVVLTTEEDRIMGPIAKDIFEYSLDIFEENLENCNFSLEELQQYQCADKDYIVYPNPSEDGTISISNNYKYSAIKNIQIFDTSGKLVFSSDFEMKPFQKAQIEFLNSGLYIIAFTCSSDTFYKKIIVQ